MFHLDFLRKFMTIPFSSTVYNYSYYLFLSYDGWMAGRIIERGQVTCSRKKREQWHAAHRALNGTRAGRTF